MVYKCVSNLRVRTILLITGLRYSIKVIYRYYLQGGRSLTTEDTELQFTK